MYNPDTEVLFPLRVLPMLRQLHGDEWRILIEHISSDDCPPLDLYAFVLMMVRLCGCIGCNADSFRAMRGCTQCAKQSVKRFRGGEREILEQFGLMKKEVGAYTLRSMADSSSEDQNS
jgi:hypothetical protein